MDSSEKQYIEEELQESFDIVMNDIEIGTLKRLPYNDPWTYEIPQGSKEIQNLVMWLRNLYHRKETYFLQQGPGK